MGIKGLTSLINEYAPDAVSIYTFNFYQRSTIAIDTSILLYKFRYLSNKNPNCHINGFLNKCLRFVSYGIMPIFILDGKPPEEKTNIIIKRMKQKNKIRIRIEDTELKLKHNRHDKKLLEELDKLNRQLICITKEHRDESKELLECLGFNVLSSSCEAETLCAELQKNGIANYTFTDDTDALVLGCKKVLRSNSGNSNTFSQINLELVLHGLKLDYNEFVDLCILCGCDYCPSIPRLNYKKAYDLISKYRTIENVLVHIENEYDIPIEYNYEIARKIFKKNNKTDIKYNTKLEFDEDRLYKFLIRKKYKDSYVRQFIKKYKQKIIFFNKITK